MGESEAPGGGGLFFIENPRGGGWGRERGRGARRVSAANWGIFLGGGGGLNFFFRGRNVHQGVLLAVYEGRQQEQIEDHPHPQ